MITRFLIQSIISFSVLWTAFPSLALPAPELVLYTYDSFIAEGGIGPEIFPLFEKKCGCKLRVVSVGDGLQLLTRLQLDHERGVREADVVLGLDQQTWDRAKPWIESWGSWSPLGYSQISPEVRLEKGFLPFDYGVFAFMADRQAMKEAGLTIPRSLQDLLKSEWKRNFILEDPRTSTPGLAFVLYSQNVVPFESFWKKLKQQWLTVSPGWAQAYGIFLKKEAPLVWSYTTSQAYHQEHGDNPKSRRYEAVLFDEGQPLQVEGAAMVKGINASPEKLQLAKNFLNFLISPQVQSWIPGKNWMFPVLKHTELPQSFSLLPRPKKLILLRKKSAEVNEILSQWRALVH